MRIALRLCLTSAMMLAGTAALAQTKIAGDVETALQEGPQSGC